MPTAPATGSVRRRSLALLVCGALGVTVACGSGDSDDRSGAGSGPSTATTSASAASGATQAPTEPCARPAPTPPPADDPWTGDAREQSEAAFQARMEQEDPEVVVSEDGWWFFGDAQNSNLSQAIGRERLSADEADAWASYFDELEAAAAEVDSAFLVLVAPAKWDVHADELPLWAQELAGETSFELLLRTHPDVPVVDVRALLREAEPATYEPTNSHWTPWGAYVAWAATVGCLQESDFPVEGLTVPEVTDVELTTAVNDFADAGAVPAGDTHSVPVYAEAQPPSEVVGLDGTPYELTEGIVPISVMPVATSTPGAQVDGKLLAFRDSMGTALSPLLARSFTSTVQMPHSIGGTGPATDLAAVIAEEAPDVTIMVMTERYLVHGPPPAP
ncbi:alginate O-acetyltransferase AlgX-related protein [Nocardioides alkalitolerans]|uniref:alginate O-acetyltransferase AlgX-related protein n=1 Tax=Nocardioides alkalitolerans TaxID=281714 RepID=UPI0003FD7433|nr:hypothetical protein [Nocardioides alkalitolerans]